MTPRILLYFTNRINKSMLEIIFWVSKRFCVCNYLHMVASWLRTTALLHNFYFRDYDRPDSRNPRGTCSISRNYLSLPWNVRIKRCWLIHRRISQLCSRGLDERKYGRRKKGIRAHLLTGHSGWSSFQSLFSLRVIRKWRHETLPNFISPSIYYQTFVVWRELSLMLASSLAYSPTYFLLSAYFSVFSWPQNFAWLIY